MRYGRRVAQMGIDGGIGENFVAWFSDAEVADMYNSGVITHVGGRSSGSGEAVAVETMSGGGAVAMDVTSGGGTVAVETMSGGGAVAVETMNEADPWLLSGDSAVAVEPTSDSDAEVRPTSGDGAVAGETMSGGGAVAVEATSGGGSVAAEETSFFRAVAVAAMSGGGSAAAEETIGRLEETMSGDEAAWAAARRTDTNFADFAAATRRMRAVVEQWRSNGAGGMDANWMPIQRRAEAELEASGSGAVVAETTSSGDAVVAKASGAEPFFRNVRARRRRWSGGVDGDSHV